jgi:hypothetical protein
MYLSLYSCRKHSHLILVDHLRHRIIKSKAVLYLIFLRNISNPTHHKTIWFTYNIKLSHNMQRFQKISAPFYACKSNCSEARFSRDLLMCFLSFIYSVFTYELTIALEGE